MAGPGILLVLPFLLPMSEFASLAAILAISQLIASIGGFGLEVSCPRLGVKMKLAAMYSFTAIIISSGFVFIAFGSQLDSKFVFGLLIAWVSSLTAIYHSYSLFAGKAKLYGIIGLAKAVIFLIILSSSIYFGISPSIAWFVSSICSLLVTFGLLEVNGSDDLIRVNSILGWRDVFGLSAPLAIIVAAGALPFVFDRALAQHLLSKIDFARYAVAVTWAVPVIYIGNVVQQSMIAAKKDDSILSVCYWGCGIFVISLIYILIFIILSLYLINIPYFENGQDFINLWGWIVGWYTIYSTISFPVAAVMQKYFSSNQLKSLAFATAGICGVSLILAYVLYVKFFSIMAIEIKLITIILFTIFFAIVGILPKIVLVTRYLVK